MVLDASIAASWYLPKQATLGTARLADDTANVWLAPYCFVHEVANLLLRQEKRGSVGPGYVEVMLQDLAVRPIRVQPPPGESRMRMAVSLARRYGISLFDGFYLDLVIETGAALATRDGLLIEAAKGEGCAVLDVRVVS